MSNRRFIRLGTNIPSNMFEYIKGLNEQVEDYKDGHNTVL